MNYYTKCISLFVLVILIQIVKARISIDVKVNQDKSTTISYSESESNIITDDDIKSFKIENKNLKEAVKKFHGKAPRTIYLKSPTPDNWYTKDKFDQVEKVLSIKSVRVKTLTEKPVIVLVQDFENASNVSIKVNTGISHTVENTLTTSWSKQKEIKVSQNIKYDFNLLFFHLGGSTDFSFVNNWGSSEEKSKTETIGTKSGLELTLQPGQGVEAVLSASAGYMEIEVVYKASLTGRLVACYDEKYKGFKAWGITIPPVMESGGISNEITTIETIKFGFHVNASLKVYDKVTGMLIL